MLYFPASAFVLVFCPLCAFACLFADEPCLRVFSGLADGLVTDPLPCFSTVSGQHL